MPLSKNSGAFPACFVEMPANAEGRRAPFYLAAEEYIAQTLPDTDDYLFTWQLSPTVVMGRNQIAHQEFDLDFCRREGIDIVRRKSGGGAIFADKNNIMISLVTGAGAVEPIFEQYASTVAAGLQSLGAPAEVSGRNDIVLRGGGKICGNAFYHLPGRNIVHGTMLYDTDPRLMSGALCPAQEKLKAKGVASVRSRISLLKDYLTMGTDNLRKELRKILTNRHIALTDADVRRIEEMAKAYDDPQYLFSRTTASSEAVRGGRIEGCGRIEIHFMLSGSIVEDIALTGDFFETGDAIAAFRRAFCGRPFVIANLLEGIKAEHPEATLRGMTEESIAALLQSRDEANAPAE